MESEQLRNADEIGAYLGVDKKSIRALKEQYGLPVWKLNGVSGPWRAFRPHLDVWLESIAKARIQQDQHQDLGHIMGILDEDK